MSGVGVAQGGGEDIRRPQVSARDEPRDLHLGGAVARLGRGVHQRSGPVVAARGLAHRAAGRVGRARVQGSSLAGCTRHGFAGAGGPSRRTHRAPPQHRDAGSSATSTCDRPRHPPSSCSRARGPQVMHLKQDASGDEGLCLQAFPGQGMLVIPVTIVRSDAPSVPEGGCGQILPGILGPRG